jgi:hypothetical protein
MISPKYRELDKERFYDKERYAAEDDETKYSKRNATGSFLVGFLGF